MENSCNYKLSLFPNTSVILGSQSHNCSFFFQPEKTPNPRSPEDPIPEVEIKEDIDQWYAFLNGMSA